MNKKSYLCRGSFGEKVIHNPNLIINELPQKTNGGKKMNALQEENLQFIKTFLEEDLNSEGDLETVKARFSITDLKSLTWTFEKVKALTDKQKEIKQVAQIEKDKIQYWESKELSSITNSLDFFQSLISEYHASVLAANPKAKTLSTPYGNAKARSTKEQPEKVNEESILQHVIHSGMDEYLKKTLKWGDFKKKLKIVEVDKRKVVVNENGEIVPGVEVKPESISFTMEVL